MKRSFVLIGFMVVFATVFMGCASTPKVVVQMSVEDLVKAEVINISHETQIWGQGYEDERTAEVEYYYFDTPSGPLPKGFVSQLQDDWGGENTGYWLGVRRVISITPDAYNETGEWQVIYGEPGKGNKHLKIDPTSVYWANELYSVLKYLK
jgi:hypothetical protein